MSHSGRDRTLPTLMSAFDPKRTLREGTARNISGMNPLRRPALLIVIAMLLTGCMGDTAFRVRGEAPEASECKLALLEDDGKTRERPVSGRFEETFVSGVCC